MRFAIIASFSALLASHAAAATGTHPPPTGVEALADSSGTAKSPADYTVHDLVDRANKALRGDSSHGDLSMTIVNPKWGERTMQVEGWNRERAYAFISILAPAKDKGNVTLRRKNEMWIWIRRVEQTTKIPASMMHTAWNGSDFTYEDIVKADSVVKDYTHKLVDKTQEKNRVVFKIEGIPKKDAPVVWGRIMLWVGVYGDEAVPLKEEDYSERGELIRTISFSDIKRLGGRLIPARMECVPSNKPGQKTIVQYSSLEFDIPLTDSFFSQSRLQKGVR
ncbi:MAG: outer membrane lipoprotein-sorting protein [Elusimicrobia bacterium]|nr:outer membrane lipoprotein-sorting protein [Elusimicrobiota bacterium]